MADITPIVSLSGQLTPEASMSGKMAMPERVYFQGPPGEKGDRGEPGSSIRSIARTGTNGLEDTYTITLTDDSTSTFTVKNGNGIASIALQSGTHFPGTTDTYKITFTNGEYTTFSVYNGMNGAGSVDTVNGKDPDDSGNVALTGADIPMSTEDETTLSAAIDEMQPLTHGLPETQPAELLGTGFTGEIPVYVAGANKKATLEHLVCSFDRYRGGNVRKVNGKFPDDSGNMEVVAANIPLVSGSQATVESALDARQKDAVLLTAVEDVADGDYFPFYDTSEKITRKTLWSNIVAKIRTALFGTLNGFLKANGSGTLSAVSTVPVANGGTGATTAAAARANLNAASNANGAIVTANLGEGVVTREKLAADALGIAIESRSDTTPFAAECNGKICVVAPSASRNFTLTSEVLAALPIGWAVTLIRGEVVGGVTYTVGWEADIPAIDGNDRKMLWSGAGSISLDRPGDMVTITKWHNLPRIIVMGNTNVRNIYAGTSAPSTGTGADGDIYVQYTN